MAVVNVPGFEPWLAGRQLFRPLMEWLRDASDTPEDVYTAEQAEALDGLHLDLDPLPQAIRLARRLLVIADEMRAEELRNDPTDEHARAEYLADLSRRLSGFLAEADGEGEEDSP